MDPDCEPASKKKRVNITIRCSLKELAACIKLLKPRHLDILEAGGLGYLRRFNIESNVCRPLIFFLMHLIDPATMTLDLGDDSKKLKITAHGIEMLFGLPRGSKTAPRPSQKEHDDGHDEVLQELKEELGFDPKR